MAETKFQAGDLDSKPQMQKMIEYVAIYSTELLSRRVNLHKLDNKGLRPFVEDVQRKLLKRSDEADIKDSIIIFGRNEYYKASKMISQYAVTTGVTKQQWEHIKREYAHTSWIKLGRVFSVDDERSAKAAVSDNLQNRLGNDFTTPEDLKGKQIKHSTTFSPGIL